MFMYYKDKKYFLAIQDYKKGNRDSAIAILKMLAKKKFVKFEEDINGFITEIQTIAKSRKDEEMIAYTKDVGNKISIIDGNSHGKTSAYENVLETESECKAALRESLKNHEYVVVINNIINFVKENKNFHAAYGVLKMLHELPIKSDYFTKEEVVLLFVEKMSKIIVDDVNPVVEGVFFKKYSSVWTQFSSNEFKKYHKIVRNYTEHYTLSNYKKNKTELKWSEWPKWVKILLIILFSILAVGISLWIWYLIDPRSFSYFVFTILLIAIGGYFLWFVYYSYTLFKKH